MNINFKKSFRRFEILEGICSMMKQSNCLLIYEESSLKSVEKKITDQSNLANE
jgi:hypothetical protein